MEYRPLRQDPGSSNESSQEDYDESFDAVVIGIPDVEHSNKIKSPVSSTISSESETESETDLKQLANPSSLIGKLRLGLLFKIAIYSVGQVVAFIYGFGAVFFACALLVFICTNLSNKPRKPDQLSAYSVFNPKFEKIPGTLNADNVVLQTAGHIALNMIH